jgi:uncharacterized protein YneR
MVLKEGEMMNINMSEKAFAWYKDELQLQKGDHVRFFVRYGGCSTVQKGFSLGVHKEEPIDAGAIFEKEGITFFIEERDLWYFDGRNLHIDFDDKLNEPIFIYE